MGRIWIIVLIAAISLLSGACASSDQPILDEVAQPDDIFSDGEDRIVILGDLQTMVYYKDNRRWLTATAAWIEAQAFFYPEQICAVIQTGDVTETNTGWEWQIFADTFRKSGETVPFMVATGNHDYEWLRDKEHFEGITDRYSSRLDSYMPYPAARKKITARFEQGSVCNAVYRINFAGKPLNIMVLEFGPRREVVEWARNYVVDHSSDRFLLVNHEFLKSDGDLTYGPWSHAFFQWIDGNYVSPDKLWEQLIAPNDNIRALICGHNGFLRLRETPNQAGRKVPQILFNLQYQEHGGDGMIMLWKGLKGDSVEVSVYDIMNKRVVPSITPFIIKL